MKGKFLLIYSILITVGLLFYAFSGSVFSKTDKVSSSISSKAGGCSGSCCGTNKVANNDGDKKAGSCGSSKKVANSKDAKKAGGCCGSKKIAQAQKQ